MTYEVKNENLVFSETLGAPFHTFNTLFIFQCLLYKKIIATQFAFSTIAIFFKIYQITHNRLQNLNDIR